MRTVRMMDKSQTGFTMLELIVVIAIIGILATLGGPQLNRWTWKMRLTQSAQGMERLITTVRKTALAENRRHCVTFASDGAWSNSSTSVYLAAITTGVETTPGSGTWAAVPPLEETAGWTNDGTSQLYKGVSLEDNTGGTDNIGGISSCTGLVFNTLGFLDNPTSDFTNDCDGFAGSAGASCIQVTLIQKALGEERTLWIDRGGNVRVSQGPAIEPAPPS